MAKYVGTRIRPYSKLDAIAHKTPKWNLKRKPQENDQYDLFVHLGRLRGPPTHSVPSVSSKLEALPNGSYGGNDHRNRNPLRRPNLSSLPLSCANRVDPRPRKQKDRKSVKKLLQDGANLASRKRWVSHTPALCVRQPRLIKNQAGLLSARTGTSPMRAQAMLLLNATRQSIRGIFHFYWLVASWGLLRPG